MTTRTRISAIAALTIAMAAVIAPSAQAAPSRHMTVSSQGTVKVVPDAVRISATSTNVGATSKEALAATAKSSAAVRAALLAARSIRKILQHRASQSILSTSTRTTHRLLSDTAHLSHLPSL